MALLPRRHDRLIDYLGVSLLLVHVPGQCNKPAAGRIKRKDPEATSSKFAEYIPYWA
jgi:hypothetical protein